MGAKILEESCAFRARDEMQMVGRRVRTHPYLFLATSNISSAIGFRAALPTWSSGAELPGSHTVVGKPQHCLLRC